MRNRSTLLMGLAALLSTAPLAGCDDLKSFLGAGDDGGYTKVANRVREDIPRPARPAPPPVVAGIGQSGPAEIPVLAAGATPPGVTQAMVEQGAELYGTVCSACHGPAGAGGPVAPALNDAEWLNLSGAYDEIVNVIHTGVATPRQFAGAMPPLGGGNFDDEQVRAIAAYVLALSQAGG